MNRPSAPTLTLKQLLLLYTQPYQFKLRPLCFLRTMSLVSPSRLYSTSLSQSKSWSLHSRYSGSSFPAVKPFLKWMMLYTSKVPGRCRSRCRYPFLPAVASCLSNHAMPRNSLCSVDKLDERIENSCRSIVHSREHLRSCNTSESACIDNSSLLSRVDFLSRKVAILWPIMVFCKVSAMVFCKV